MRNDSQSTAALPGHRPGEWSFLEFEARNLGFVAVGVSPAEPVPAIQAKRFLEWVDAGHHASMSHLEKNNAQRQNPGHENMVAGATAIVSAALPYGDGQESSGLWPKIAAHARGKDYHFTVKEKLNILATRIQERFATESYRIFVDSAPVMERTWAVLSGLGSIGRHGGLIVPYIGARVVLGEIVLAGPTCTEKNPHPASTLSPCTQCSACVDACPTSALNGDGTLVSSQCLSFQTAEMRERELDAEVVEHLSTLFGCDICTKACPLDNPQIPSELESIDSHLGQLNKPSELLELSQGALARMLKDTALARTGPRTIKRNARYLSIRQRK